MSSSKPFSREELNRLSRWEFPQVGDDEEEALPPEPVIEEIVEPPYIPTAEEIESMQKQAYDEAFAQGMSEGSERGYREGWELGQKEGHEQGLAQGHEAGYAQGRSEGLESGRSEMESARDHFLQLIDCLDEPLKTMDETVESELVALVIAIARQLIRHELNTQPDQIVSLVRETLGLLPVSARRVSLHLHPHDAERVRARLHQDDTPLRWKIVESADVSAGGCTISTENSHIDASVEKRLATAISQLLGGEPGEGEPA